MKASFKAGLIVAFFLALVPALVGAAPPSPKGKLVYQDDFSDPKKSGLEDNLAATDYSRGFHAPGVYHLKGIKSNETHWSLFPKQSYGKLTLEADVWDNSDDFKGDISEGLIVRAKDDTHLYAILVDPRKGQYAARKLDGKDKWSDLIAWTPSALIKQQSGVNHLRVDADGNTFTIYLNDESLGSFSDAAYTTGSIGLIASNVDAANNHMHYDNIKVYTTEAQPASTATNPSSLPNTGQTSSDTTALMAGLALALLCLGLWVRSLRQSAWHDNRS